MGELKYY